MTQARQEQAILVGVEPKRGASLWSLQDSLEELGRLAETAGARVVGCLLQRLERPTPCYLGQGKLEELKETIATQGADVVLFNDELTPAQQRNLEQALQVKVLDRTALILDVFARHAHTREGQLQVELAQYQYLLPRLAGQWTHLERLGGGIGTRGPGETQLETDRRLVRRRIEKLKEGLEAVRRHRALYRRRRRATGTPVASLVGYTNAGKSTLLNALSKAGVVVQDQLFSTLDPVTRRVALPSGRHLLVTDTVGFIHKLSHQLVAAFRATLEELQEATVLLHVVDITHHNAAEQAQVVDDILRDLGVDQKPRILALNKVDLLISEAETHLDLRVLGSWVRDHPAVLISAEREWGLDRLLDIMDEQIQKATALPFPTAAEVG